MTDDVIASPSLRKRAGDRGIDLGALARDLGRAALTHDDLDRAEGGPADRHAAAPGPAAGDPARYWQVDHAAHGPVAEEPVSRLGRAAADNLAAAATIPQVTHHDRAAIGALEAFRASLRAEAASRGIRLTPLAFQVMALARALREHPRVNASLSPDAATLVLKDYVHVGIAVDTPHGLLVPVLRDADTKGAWQIAAEIADLAARARDRKLAPEEMAGASITISSLGAIGGTAFTPIVNPPQLAILGLTPVTTDPVWTGDAFEPRQHLPLHLSYDHRAINGADAAKLTNTLKKYIEKPEYIAV